MSIASNKGNKLAILLPVVLLVVVLALLLFRPTHSSRSIAPFDPEQTELSEWLRAALETTGVETDELQTAGFDLYYMDSSLSYVQIVAENTESKKVTAYQLTLDDHQIREFETDFPTENGIPLTRILEALPALQPILTQETASLHLSLHIPSERLFSRADVAEDSLLIYQNRVYEAEEAPEMEEGTEYFVLSVGEEKDSLLIYCLF